MLRPASRDSIHEAAQILRRGGLVAFPTETVYGLGADALQPAAVRRIFEAKGRPSTNPLIVHLATLRDVPRVALLTPQQEQWLIQLQPFMPGPLTVVLPKHPSVPDETSAGQRTIALRIPDHLVAQSLLEMAQIPIAAPSANPSTYVSPTRAEHVEATLGDKIDLVLDGGPCTVGIESTIVLLTEQVPRLLRPGAVTLEQLQHVLGEVRYTALNEAAPTTPGSSVLHYSPRTPVAFRDDVDDDWLPERVGLIAFQARGYEHDLFPYTAFVALSEHGDLEQVARRLFDALRSMDAMGLDMILVDRCEEQGMGLAIMDRLRRAVGRPKR